MASSLDTYFGLLVRHETRIWGLIEQRLRSTPETVTLGRFEVLRVVEGAGGECRVQDVADAMLITVGAASRIIDRIVADGLLARAPHPTDRRSNRLTLTPNGHARLVHTARAFETALEDLLGDIDRRLIKTLSDGLDAVEAHLVRPIT